MPPQAPFDIDPVVPVDIGTQFDPFDPTSPIGPSFPGGQQESFTGTRPGFDIGDFATLVNLALGLAAGFEQARAERRAERATEEQRRRARQAASPENLQRNLQALQNQFRELVQAGLGPQFQSAIAANIGRAGLAGTGRGLTLQGAAQAAPAIFTLGQAIPAAQTLQSGQVGAELGILSAGFPALLNPLIQGLAQAAQGAFTTQEAAQFGRRDQPGRQQELFPGVSPRRR